MEYSCGQQTETHAISDRLSITVAARVQRGMGSRPEDVIEKRFLLLSDVADILNISAAQTYALVRSGELPAIKVGGRGQWRVEAHVLESYIQDAYKRTREFVSAHPFGANDVIEE
jgi:excisionase family DNA binding protein